MNLMIPYTDMVLSIYYVLSMCTLPTNPLPLLNQALVLGASIGSIDILLFKWPYYNSIQTFVYRSRNCERD